MTPYLGYLCRISVILLCERAINSRSFCFRSNQHNDGSGATWYVVCCSGKPGSEKSSGPASGIHNSQPILGRTLLDLDLQPLPICIDHHVDSSSSLCRTMQTKRQAP